MTVSTYHPREDGESLAMHLHRNAEALGADRDQRARLRQAAALSLGGRDARILGGQIAAEIRDQLKASMDAVVFAAQARGEKVVPYKDEGAKRIKSRDGLGSMFDSGALTEAQWNAGLVYRSLYEAVGSASLGSQLGQVSEGSSARTSTDAMVRHGLQAAYASVRLTEAEKAVRSPEMVALLRAVAGEGRTIGSLTTSGHRRKCMAAALASALDAAAPALAGGMSTALDAVALSLSRTGGLRITGS